MYYEIYSFLKKERVFSKSLVYMYINPDDNLRCHDL